MYPRKSNSVAIVKQTLEEDKAAEIDSSEMKNFLQLKHLI